MEKTSTFKQNQPPNPIHHDFYHHTYLSWTRLLKQPNTRPKANRVTPIGVDRNLIVDDVELTAIPDTIHIPSLKAQIYNIASLSITLALFAISVVIATIALINALKPSVPTGTILVFSGTASTLTSNNEDWLYCDGSSISRTKYRDLFDVIGTKYGQGDGVNTFNLPDLRDRFIRGSTSATSSQLQTGGSETVILTIPNLPPHDHTEGSLSALSNGVHSHSINDPGHNHGGSTGAGRHGGGSSAFAFFGGSSEGATHTHSIPLGTTGISIFSNGAHTHTITGTTGSVGSSQPINILPPYTTMHYLIKI